MTKEREEWLGNRTKGIGGSDAAVILGISPWKSQLELWIEKTTGVVKEDNDNPNFRWGNVLEPVIAEEYEKETGRIVANHKRQITHKKYPFMNANIDRLIYDYDNDKGFGILEIKTKGAFIDWKDDEIPIYYMAQIQHYLSVTGYKWASFVAFDMGKKKLIIHDVERDEDYIDNLIIEEDKFWNLVYNRIPPEPDSSKACNEFLKNVYKEQIKGKQIDLSNNDYARDYVILYKNMKAQIKELEEKELDCKNNLMNIMKDAETGIGKDFKITWKNDKDSSKFDVDKFKEENLDLYNKYLEPKKGIRRFTVKFTN